jgi:MarR family transcriptional regulator, organic hydroperoxide resistance regulator
MVVRKRVAIRTADEAERLLRHWHDAVPNDRLAHLVKDASRAFVRALQSRLALHGVPFGHWTFLRILWERDGLTQRELSAEAGLMEPTTHVALNAMERLGYIRRRRLAANRRNVYVYLTAKGRALKGKLVPLAESVNETGIEGVEGADIATTRRVLIAIIDNLARDAVAPATTLPRKAQSAAQNRGSHP